MKRGGALVVVAVVALTASNGTVLAAGPPASMKASCVGIITSYEGSQLDPRSVGAEVSGLATSAPGLGSRLVSGLAKEHAGSIEACIEAEE